MAESRDQILIDFQGVTGIEDFDLCTNILTQHDWNLERAVNSIMGFGPSDGGGFTDEVGPSPAEHLDDSHQLFTDGERSERLLEAVDGHPRPSDHGASDMASGLSYSSSPLNFAGRMIYFNVEYRDKNNIVVLPDSEAVGRIKEILEAELGIPRDKQQLKGLVKRKVDDSTLLRDLHLPRENSLYLLTPDITRPTINKTVAHEGEGTSQGLEGDREYTLKITFLDGSKYKHYSLKFPCNKTVRDVKQTVFTLTDIQVRHQEWSGWNKPVNDQDKLFACDLNYPVHDLEVTKSQSAIIPKAPDPEEMEVDSDDEDTGLENYSLEDDLFSQEPNTSYRLGPLIPEGIGDDKEALEHFSKEFTNRYGECHPQFLIGSLDDAIQESFGGARPADRKLLAVYLHHDSSIFSNVFCSRLLCAEGIVTYLSIHFITWAWDLTVAGNVARFIQAATRHFGSLTTAQLKANSPDQFPSLLLISRSKSTNEVLDAIQSHVTQDEMMARLIHAVELFQEQKQAELNEGKEREARERIKQEQDMAYQESLSADKKKAEAQKMEEDKMREEMDRLIEEQKEVEDQRQEQKLIKEAISKSIATTVPEEPAENSTARVCRLRFRAPKGEIITRRFLAENTLSDLLNFLTSVGFHTEDFKVLTTFPRRDVSALGLSSTLEALKLYPQETLILEER